jgi:hypothetical protein
MSSRAYDDWDDDSDAGQRIPPQSPAVIHGSPGHGTGLQVGLPFIVARAFRMIVASRGFGGERYNMTMNHLIQRVRRIAVRTFVAFALSGGVALGYGVATGWLLTRSTPTPLAGVIALLSASLTLAIDPAPALVVARFLRYLERIPTLLAARPSLSARELAERLECSEAEVNDLRRLIAGIQQAPNALTVLRSESAPEPMRERAA